MKKVKLGVATGLVFAFAGSCFASAQQTDFSSTQDLELTPPNNELISVEIHSAPAQGRPISTMGPGANSMLAQAPNSGATQAAATQTNDVAAQGTPYYETVSNMNCLANNSCTFTFPVVPAVGGGLLTNPRVNCRLVTTNISHGVQNPLTYAALGTTANAAKIFFLSSSVAAYFELGISANTHSVYLIDQKTVFFVPAGASPMVTIVTGPSSAAAIAAPNPDLDQPTCSVSGIVR